jgi:hypothetical protein
MHATLTVNGGEVVRCDCLSHLIKMERINEGNILLTAVVLYGKHLMVFPPVTNDQVTLAAHSKEFCLTENSVTCTWNKILLNSFNRVHIGEATRK